MSAASRLHAESAPDRVHLSGCWWRSWELCVWHRYGSTALPRIFPYPAPRKNPDRRRRSVNKHCGAVLELRWHGAVRLGCRSQLVKSAQYAKENGMAVLGGHFKNVRDGAVFEVGGDQFVPVTLYIGVTAGIISAGSPAVFAAKDGDFVKDFASFGMRQIQATPAHTITFQSQRMNKLIILLI